LKHLKAVTFPLAVHGSGTLFPLSVMQYAHITSSLEGFYYCFQSTHRARTHTLSHTYFKLNVQSMLYVNLSAAAATAAAAAAAVELR
jgi:hypothetical protein